MPPVDNPQKSSEKTPLPPLLQAFISNKERYIYISEGDSLVHTSTPTRAQETSLLITNY